MPELPEVEAVRRALEPEICGREMHKAILKRPDIVAHPLPGDLAAGLSGQKIAALSRRGKFLQFEFFSGDTLVLHLRMTGRLSLVPPELDKPAHTHLCVLMDDGREFRFTDSRRLGRVWLLRAGEEDRYTGILRLGPEPYDVGVQELQEILQGRKRPIKSALMDQHLIAGLGNIYADEVLFRAGISPLRPAGELSMQELNTLVEVMPQTLTEAVERGVSCSSYLFGKHIPRRQPAGWKVYGKKGKPCAVCGTLLTGVRIAGRSSVYCPNCQR